jgi:hypothetical protein
MRVGKAREEDRVVWLTGGDVGQERERDVKLAVS